MLHIVANTHFFLTDFVMQSLQGVPGVRVLAHEHRRRGWAASLTKLAQASLPWAPLHTFSPHYLAQLQAIAPGDSVLFFGLENVKELRILLRHLHARRCTLFTWNPVCDYQQNPWLRRWHARALQRLGPELVTFDPHDARTHGLRLVDQVYRDVTPWQPTPARTPDIDWYFVGQDKGRLATLQALLSSAQHAGLRCHFHITADRHRRYSPAERALLSPAPLPYADNLAWIARARCLVEVAQPHQSGATVRSLEAAFFGKKLLTTRALATHDALYHPARVFIHGHDDPSHLPTFMHCAYPAPDPAVLARHDIRHWCQQFVA